MRKTQEQRIALVNDFAIRSFRDVADQDYIAARLAFRAHLWPQFHWSALQALEKYLKCILLLNRIRARDIRHDLGKALAHAARLPFALRLSPSARSMIEHLDAYGQYRYLESSFVVRGPLLFDLDRAVWDVRRYCRVLDQEVRARDGTKRSLLGAHLAAIEGAEAIPFHRFRILGGWLERIMDDPRNPARAPLIWQNHCFGARARSSVRMFGGLHATNAPLSLHPEVLDEIRRYVHLPNHVADAYRSELERRRRASRSP